MGRSLINYHSIVEHYENCLRRHGDNHRGMDWPNADHAERRMQVMLEMIPSGASGSLLDIGCGTGHLLEYMRRQPSRNLTYEGLDLSPAMLQYAREKHPSIPFHQVDLIANPNAIGQFDYAIMNGVLTEKLGFQNGDMFDYAQKLLTAAFSKVNSGLAFNVMSKLVDWERDDLFHVGFDDLAKFVATSLSRHFVIRHDYGLYEYTVYVYRNPRI